MPPPTASFRAAALLCGSPGDQDRLILTDCAAYTRHSSGGSIRYTASRTVAEPAWAALCAMARPLAAPVLNATVGVGAVASDARAETITTVSGCRGRCGWAGSHLELSRGVACVWSSFADGSQLAVRPFAYPPAWLRHYHVPRGGQWCVCAWLRRSLQCGSRLCALKRCAALQRVSA